MIQFPERTSFWKRQFLTENKSMEAFKVGAYRHIVDTLFGSMFMPYRGMNHFTFRICFKAVDEVKIS